MLHNYQVPWSMPDGGELSGAAVADCEMGWDTGSIHRRTGLCRRRAGFLRRAGGLLRNGLRLLQGGSCGLTIRHQRPVLPLSDRNARWTRMDGHQLIGQIAIELLIRTLVHPVIIVSSDWGLSWRDTRSGPASAHSWHCASSSTPSIPTLLMAALTLYPLR